MSGASGLSELTMKRDASGVTSYWKKANSGAVTWVLEQRARGPGEQLAAADLYGDFYQLAIGAKKYSFLPLRLQRGWAVLLLEI